MKPKEAIYYRSRKIIGAAFPLALFLICGIKPAPVEGAEGGLVPPVNEDDPELYEVWTTPTSFEFWWRYSSGSEYVGNLFAGRAEFPFVVDIRSNDLDSEQWSTGNLVTSLHVLTAARSLEYLIDESRWNFYFGQAKEVDEGLLLNYEYVGVEVNFCGNYLWEEYKYNSRVNTLAHTDTNVFDNDVKDSGSRYARYIYVHPFYIQHSLSFDIGIIKMNNQIRPIPGVVDHMPIWYDNEKGQVTDVNLGNMIKQRRVCYVASFGRNWVNHYQSYVTDYKVRYRVYFRSLTDCRNNMKYFRTANWISPLIFDATEGKDGDNLMCFGTRAKVSAICDHDRGAPLVCDSRVYGFVIRGANFSNCNNLLSLPFFVQKGSLLNAYYASITRHVFVPRFAPKGASSTGRISASVYTIISIVLLHHNLYKGIMRLLPVRKGKRPLGRYLQTSCC